MAFIGNITHAPNLKHLDRSDQRVNLTMPLQLLTGQAVSIRQLAEQEKLDADDISRTLPLAFLAPEIVASIMEGRQPIDLTTDKLKRQSGQLPFCWKRQKAVLGFSG